MNFLLIRKNLCETEFNFFSRSIAQLCKARVITSELLNLNVLRVLLRVLHAADILDFGNIFTLSRPLIGQNILTCATVKFKFANNTGECYNNATQQSRATRSQTETWLGEKKVCKNSEEQETAQARTQTASDVKNKISDQTCTQELFSMMINFRTC